MIVIELNEDKFGRAMKNITCIEDKLQELKEVFEDEAMDYRSQDFPYEEDYKPYSYKREKRQREYPKEYSRYM